MAHNDIWICFIKVNMNLSDNNDNSDDNNSNNNDDDNNNDKKNYDVTNNNNNSSNNNNNYNNNNTNTNNNNNNNNKAQFPQRRFSMVVLHVRKKNLTPLIKNPPIKLKKYLRLSLAENTLQEKHLF